MTKKEALAANYWLENTQKIYDKDLHISSPIMDAYKAGFDKALELAAKKFDPYSNEHNQEFSDGDDSVQFTYRVMSIIASNILSTGNDKENE